MSHPELRAFYDALLREPDAPALFPYGGCGRCLVSGGLSDDGETFFASQILAYLPTQTQRTFRAPLRRIEYFEGYAVYRDSRRKVEVYMDPSVLPLNWDVTWNQWKSLIGTKVGISGLFLNSPRYRQTRGEWQVAVWQTALPSRLKITVPSDAAASIGTARLAFQRFGEYYDEIQRIRTRLEDEPVEQSTLYELCRKLRLPSDFDVAQLCWKPDYDGFFYEQLKKRSVNVYLFRTEYIFELRRAMVAEIPQLGHASYVFAKPADIREFVGRYAATSRDDIRKNRGNVAGELGFIGRVMHGRNPKTWLKDLSARIGESVDYSLMTS